MNTQNLAGMGAYQGTFVISWSQCRIDGMANLPLEAVSIGASWSWAGEIVQVDGPRDVLVLGAPLGEGERRRSAARKVRKLLGAALGGPLTPSAQEPAMPDQSFTVTDGFAVYVVTVVEAERSGARLLMFAGRVPPAQTEMWVVDRAFEIRAVAERAGSGVICFTQGTMIETPSGPRAVEDLHAGDMVCTVDDGVQPLVWTGSRRMTGARLFAMPELRPIRFRAGAFGIGRPDADLLVSPEHRMLIQGPAARALFNEAEVLVQARDLVNGSTVRVEQGLAELRYVHLMFERHQVIRANGFESESFHPASMALEQIPVAQRETLLGLYPELAYEPLTYGAYARRALSAAEALILRHDLAA